MIQTNKKVAIGLSGGVDSAVSAYLLKAAGYDVHAFYMKNWHDNEALCTQHDDLNDASIIAQQLAIPLEVVDFADAYYQDVFESMLKQYQKGWVPNPDIWCNQYIKFDQFFNYIQARDFDYLATGHYAQIQHDRKGPLLTLGADSNKDQTYFLCAINKSVLAKTLFPIGHLTKQAVRELAESYGLVVADKKDSTGICFVGPKSMRSFLQSYLIGQPGPIKDEQNRTLNHHQGVIFYTLGQRQGLNIGGTQDGFEKPWYVVKKDIINNELIVSQNPFQPQYAITDVTCKDFNWLIDADQHQPIQCRTRHRGELVDVHLASTNPDETIIQFNKPLYHLSQGQWCVLYQDGICLGGGQIAEISYSQN